MIKKAYPTGLLYLCQTSTKDPLAYRGSGKRWINHLRAHNPRIITCILGSYETHDELREAGIHYSRVYNVVEDDNWANLREEDGNGGGRGKIGRTWKVKDTSRMKGPKDRTTEACKAGYARISVKMIGDNNPSRRFAPTKKQIESAKRCQRLRTEKSMKAVLVTYPNGNQEHFESKRQVCNKLGISYDVLNYRITRNMDLNGINFKELK